MTVADATAAAFLADIIAHPGDDALRLIYADWLDEHDSPERAEFIRVQCEVAFLRKVLVAPDIDSRVMALCRRERALLCPNFDCWYGLPKDPHGHIWDMMNFDDDDPEPEARWRALFCRGFVEEVTLPLAIWLEHGRALVRAAPLRIVRLIGSMSAPSSREGIRSWYEQLRRLAVDDEPGDNPVSDLDTLDLSRLAVNHWHLNAAMLEAYRPWRGLRRLVLPNWSDLEERYRPHEIEQWQKRIPSLVEVRFA